MIKLIMVSESNSLSKVQEIRCCWFMATKRHTDLMIFSYRTSGSFDSRRRTRSKSIANEC